MNSAGADTTAAELISAHLRPLVENESSSGDLLEPLIIRRMADGEYGGDDFLMLALAFCGDAMRAILRGESSAAWSYLVDAHFYVDGMKAIAITANNSEAQRKNTAQRLLDAQHSDARATKAKAIAWYVGKRDEYANKDEAAEHIALVFPGVAAPRARKWLRNV